MRVGDLKPAFHAATIGHIYEAALDPQRWQDVIDALERVYPDARITLFGHRNGRPQAAFSFRKNFADADVRLYADHFVKNSPFIQRLDRVPLFKPNGQEIMISNAELFKTEYYNEFMRPRRLGHYSNGIIFERSTYAMTALAIADHKDDQDRRQHQRWLLRVLLPHLKRAIELHRVISAERATAMAMRTVFDRWSHAAFVLDETATTVSKNAAATSLLARESCIWLDREGHLRGYDCDEGSALETAIRRCARLADRRDPEGLGDGQESFALRRPAPATPLYAMAWPLPFDGSPELGGGRGRVLVIVFDPQSVQRTPVGWLAQRYELSPAQAKLTEAIVNGVPLADAAEQLGIQLSTARTRLKIIQSKTGCNRQVDLVRLALSAPPIRHD
jgi:DNA-binding CsgD family transcriptional regulator